MEIKDKKCTKKFNGTLLKVVGRILWVILGGACFAIFWSLKVGMFAGTESTNVKRDIDDNKKAVAANVEDIKSNGVEIKSNSGRIGKVEITQAESTAYLKTIQADIAIIKQRVAN